MRKLDPHQIRATHFINKLNGNAGLFMAPGTGKTIVAIRQAKSPTLVICRRDDFLTWRFELEMEGVKKHRIYFIDHGDRKKRKLHLPNMNVGNPRYDWVVVTYDLMKKERIHEWAKSSQFKQVIADEAHVIKRWAAKRTRAVFTATRHIPRRLAMTGSAITNDPIDVFAICKFIDGGKLFGDNEFWFKMAYYVRSGPGWYKKRDADDRISRKLQNISFYVHEDDVLKLPPIRHVVKSAPMSAAQKKHYESVLTEWETQLANGDVLEIDHIIVQLQKLKQISSGFIYNPEGKPEWFKSGKMDLVMQDMRDHEYLDRPKVVIWCSATAEIHRVAELAAGKGAGFVKFFGSDRKIKEEARLRFRDDPSVQYFIGQVDSGVGMNELIVADTAAYVSNSLKVVSRQQSMRRIRRRGSEHHKLIRYYDYCTEGTLDLQLSKSINSAMSLAHRILSECRGKGDLQRFLT